MQLSDSEIKELESLENYEKNPYQYLSPSTQPFFSGLANLFSNDPGKMSKEKRKERIVELKTLKRLYEEDKNPNDDFQRYYEIRKEEEDKIK